MDPTAPAAAAPSVTFDLVHVVLSLGDLPGQLAAFFCRFLPFC